MTRRARAEHPARPSARIDDNFGYPSCVTLILQPVRRIAAPPALTSAMMLSR